MVVTSKKAAKLFYLSQAAYNQAFREKFNEFETKRLNIVKEHFVPFREWEDQRLRNLINCAKDRLLCNDECLIREQQAQSDVYMLVSGKLRVERKVKVESNNYWPDTDQCWVEKKVASNVLFKISEILPMQMFGERDCI